MTAKEKVLAVHPMAEVWMATDNEFWISHSEEDDVDYGWGETEEAAWQNAAESLPAQLEQKVVYDAWGKAGRLQPVAPVEAKEKKPVCATCDEPIYQREEFGDKAWCHTIGGMIMSNGHVAEPKPTPSAQAHEPLAEKIIRRVVTSTIRSMWTRNIEPLESDPDAEFPTEDELVIDALALALGEDIGCLDEKDDDFRERIDLLWLEDQLKPQPDSSSISTEQTFEQWWESDGQYWNCTNDGDSYEKAISRKAWNAAKGQSNGL